MFLAVESFEVERKKKSHHTESGEYDHRNGVVVMNKEAFRSFLSELFPFGKLCKLARHARISGIDSVEYVSDKQRHKAQADILNPENETVGAAEHFFLMILGTEGQRAAGTRANDMPSTTIVQ